MLIFLFVFVKLVDELNFICIAPFLQKASQIKRIKAEKLKSNSLIAIHWNNKSCSIVYPNFKNEEMG